MWEIDRMSNSFMFGSYLKLREFSPRQILKPAIDALVE